MFTCTATQEEAAKAYDIAAIKFRGLNAVTNFEINRYDVKAILNSTALPIGGAAKRLKDVEDLTATSDKQLNRAITCADTPDNSQLTSYGNGCHNFHSWPGIPFSQAQPLAIHYPYATSQHQRLWCNQQVQDTHEYQHHFNQQLQLNMEHCSGSNYVVYGNGNGNDSVGGGVYEPPLGMSTVVAQDGYGDENGNEQSGCENYCYLSHQGSSVREAVACWEL